jgi:hypothetical protein
MNHYKKSYFILGLLLLSLLWCVSCKSEQTKTEFPPVVEAPADTTAVVDTIVAKLDAFAATVEANKEAYTLDASRVGGCTTTYYEIGTDKMIHKITTSCRSEIQDTDWTYYKFGTSYQLVEYKEVKKGDTPTTRYRKIYLVNEADNGVENYYKVFDENGNRPQESLDDWINIVEGGLSSQ